MTDTAAAIVTALGDGPSTARELSQRIDGIGYANIRQLLRRLAAAGVVTKLRRGLYGIEAGADCDSSECKEAAPDHRRDEDEAEVWAVALALVWADFEAMNDPHDPRAWA